MSEAPAIRCPRCRHDVGGVRTSWTEHCPVDGRCPECGLGFRWGEAIGGVLGYPRWTTEDARGPRSFVLRSVAQVFVASVGVPWMAASLRLEHRIRWSRLIGGLIGVVALVLGLACGYVFVDVLGEPRATIGRAAAIAAWPPAWPNSHRIGPARAPLGHVLGVEFESMGDDGDVRILGFTPVPVDQISEVFAQELTVWGYVIETSLYEVLQRDILRDRFLLETRTNERILVDGLPESVDPIAFLRAVEEVRFTTYWHPPFRFHGRPLLGVLAAMPLAAAAFGLLPLARREARVQWRHLVRLAVYAAIGALPVWAAGAAVWASLIGTYETVGEMLGIVGPLHHRLAGQLVMFGLGPAGLAAGWWTIVAHWHLRMRHAWLVGTSVGLIAGLATGVVAVIGFQAAGPG